MAIGTTSLFSKISGSAGPVDFRTRRNGKIEIGKKRIPANPQSTRQQEVRAGYGRLHELWQNASYIDKAQYERLGQLYNVSAWNAFLMRHQSTMCTAPICSLGMVESSGLDLHDLTKNSAHGTISGMTWEELGPAKLSYLRSDGIDDYVGFGVTDKFAFTTESFSIEMWISVHGWDCDQYIFSNGWGTIGGYTSFIQINNRIYFRTGQPTPASQFTYSKILDKTTDWRYIAIARSGPDVDIFENAINITANPAVHIDPTSDTTPYLGANRGHLLPLKASISNPAIYSPARSQADFLRHFENTKHLYGVYP